MSLSTVVLLISLALGLIGSGLAYHKGKTTGRQEALSTLQKDDLKRQQELEAIQRSVSEAVAKVRVINKTLIQTTEREIVKEPIYVDCKHSPDGLRLVNSALSGTATANVITNTELPSKPGSP